MCDSRWQTPRNTEKSGMKIENVFSVAGWTLCLRRGDNAILRAEFFALLQIDEFDGFRIDRRTKKELPDARKTLRRICHEVLAQHGGVCLAQQV